MCGTYTQCNTTQPLNNAICSNTYGLKEFYKKQTKDKCDIISLIFRILKKDTSEFIYKIEMDSQT